MKQKMNPMKKILSIMLVLALVSVSASAQFHGDRLNRHERLELRRDIGRERFVTRESRRDGVVGPLERRRIHRAKCATRRDAFRFRHNGRNRII